tara:strand:+ start:1132 stop:2415 length:1284 start_codon:yes stop_codon:yes gene_type:complete
MIKKQYLLAKKILFPINRSITGKGTVKTLKIIQDNFPMLNIKKIKSGTKSFDWKIPEEWNIKNGYILDKHNNKIIDFNNNNLHIVGYSMPVNKTLNKGQLLKKIFSLKNQPEAIPYITSYYKKTWGFCCSHIQKKNITKNYKTNDKFKVFIDSNFNKSGQLNYGELVLPGESSQEILISTYVCHPSMANNELSGPIVAMALIDYFKKKKLKKTLRFLFIPETIGSIAYLSKNLKKLKKNVIGGFVISCIGDDKNHSCMFSKYKNSPSDYAIIKAYKNLKIKKYKIYSFLERGSDERQYCSPGIDLPITSIFRTKYGEYPEYHTSLDNFNIVTLKGVTGGFKVVKEAINILLNNIYPINKILCEPQMGRRGLYRTLSNKKKFFEKKYLDFLQYSDGKNSINDIKTIINTSSKVTKKIYLKLKNNFLVE